MSVHRELLCQLDSIDSRHHDVKDGDVRFVTLNTLPRGTAVGCHRNNFKIAPQQRNKLVEHSWVIVGDDDAQSHTQKRAAAITSIDSIRNLGLTVLTDVTSACYRASTP